MDAIFTPEAAAAICRHMNDDHADAIAAYARTFADITDVRAAEMLGLDAHAMEIRVETGNGHVITHIAFDHALASAADARDTLIAMARRAMTQT